VFLELTLRFFSVREVFAENGIDADAASFMWMSSGVLCRDAAKVPVSTADLGISSSLNSTGDRAPGGDESGVE
jgi:hypothetical protein